MGELHPTVLENFGIEVPVYHFELDFEGLVRLSRVITSVVAPSRFPDVQRDLALLVPVEVPSQEIVDSIRGQKVKELEGLDIFDYYTGSHVPEGKKSIAVRLRYRLADRTLTDDEVNRVHGRILDSLCRCMPVTIR
jgi:phenylalanyl-tRNA synthetase beta chain